MIVFFLKKNVVKGQAKGLRTVVKVLGRADFRQDLTIGEV